MARQSAAADADRASRSAEGVRGNFQQQKQQPKHTKAHVDAAVAHQLMIEPGEHGAYLNKLNFSGFADRFDGHGFIPWRRKLLRWKHLNHKSDQYCYVLITTKLLGDQAYQAYDLRSPSLQTFTTLMTFLADRFASVAELQVRRTKLQEFKQGLNETHKKCLERFDTLHLAYIELRAVRGHLNPTQMAFVEDLTDVVLFKFLFNGLTKNTQSSVWTSEFKPASYEQLRRAIIDRAERTLVAPEGIKLKTTVKEKGPASARQMGSQLEQDPIFRTNVAR